jgi:hypothetical protein
MDDAPALPLERGCLAQNIHRDERRDMRAAGDTVENHDRALATARGDCQTRACRVRIRRCAVRGNGQIAIGLPCEAIS